MKLRLICVFIMLAALAGVAPLHGAVAFSVTPASVSNTYNGPITLQVTGLTAGDTVVVQKYFDANTNGVIDAGDLLWQQFSLTDGSNFVIGGVTNNNVPGDLNPAAGAVTALLNFQGDFAQSIAGGYLYVLSSPSNRFAPITNSLVVTAFPFGQRITGAVVSGAAPVPNAVVLLFPPDGSPVGGAVAGNSGAYSIQAPSGNYLLVAYKPGYVASFRTAPAVVLGANQTIKTNASLTAATETISGRIVDSVNTNAGVPGILLPVQTQDKSLLGICVTDTNGYFTAGVTPTQWGIGGDSAGLAFHGYVGYQGKAVVDTSTGSVAGLTFALPRGTALFYGKVTDGAGHPPGSAVAMYGQDNNGNYQSDGYTDSNGNYVTMVLGGLGVNDTWNISVDNKSAFPNEIFSQPQIDQNGGANLVAGQAFRADFSVLAVTAQISGSLKDASGKPIANVDVYASATMNGNSFNQNGTTDANGNYSMGVANGTWSVGVNCCNNCGGNSLPSNYGCPNQQTVNISGGNTVVNFTAISPGSDLITGSLKDGGGNPVPNVQINASAVINGNNVNQSAITDGNGNYSMAVANGNWSVFVNCCTGNNCNNGLPANYGCPNTQNVNLSNGNAVVNFTVISLGAEQITGTLKDAGGKPIPNVEVGASATINGGNLNQSAITDATGHYSLGVAPGSWNVYVNCCTGNNCNNTLPSIYQCPNQQNVNITSGNAVVNFVAPSAGAFQISGAVADENGRGVTNVVVTATTALGGISVAATGPNGSFTLYVGPGDWVVGVDCAGLSAQGYACVGSQVISIVNTGNGVNFTVQPCGPLQVTTTTLADGFVGSNYTSQLLTTGCHPPFTWSLTQGSAPLPPGLVLSTNGVLSGTPTVAATNQFYAHLVDGQGNTADGLVTIAVYPPLAIASGPLANGLLGVSYNASIPVSGGPTGFSGASGANIVAGALPPGLNLGSDVFQHSLSVFGTPTQLGTFQFTALLVEYDSFGAYLTTAQAVFTITITKPNLQITTTSISGGAAGKPFSFQLQASGGAAPFSWSVAPGSQGLPSWLTLSTSGVLSGTPPAAGTTQTILQVIDANQLTATAPVQITFGPSLVIGLLGSPVRFPNGAFQFTASAPTGQTYTVQYSVALTNWISLFATNPTASPFTVTDAGATNQLRFYRLLLPAP